MSHLHRFSCQYFSFRWNLFLTDLTLKKNRFKSSSLIWYHGWACVWKPLSCLYNCLISIQFFWQPVVRRPSVCTRNANIYTIVCIYNTFIYTKFLKLWPLINARYQERFKLLTTILQLWDYYASIPKPWPLDQY